MAIFRAGKRIGNMDIRVGLPRDKSLDNVEGDKRITVQRPGVNRKTSIEKFAQESKQTLKKESKTPDKKAESKKPESKKPDDKKPAAKEQPKKK